MDWLLDERNTELISTLDLKEEQEKMEREVLSSIFRFLSSKLNVLHY